MNEYSETFLYKLRFVFVGLLMVASLILLPFFVSLMTSSTAQAQGNSSVSNISNSDSSDDANLLTAGLFGTVDRLNQTMDSVAVKTSNGFKATASATSHGAEAAAQSAQTGISTAARGVGRGFAFAFNIPASILGTISKSSAVGAVIRPSDHEESVPIIDPDSPELLAALSTLPPKNENTSGSGQNNLGPLWPIHGVITAEFGVPHWPYQPTHTGLDISDGKPRGITPVNPFRPGKVIEAVHSNYGFGNHVIIDHGNGITSLYGHLDSFNVKVGDDVNLNTIIGLEGTTGLSTGVHLHFEVRVNGLAANPHQFVDGQP